MNPVEILISTTAKDVEWAIKYEEVFRENVEHEAFNSFRHALDDGAIESVISLNVNGNIIGLVLDQIDSVRFMRNPKIPTIIYDNVYNGSKVDVIYETPTVSDVIAQHVNHVHEYTQTVVDDVKELGIDKIIFEHKLQSMQAVIEKQNAVIADLMSMVDALKVFVHDVHGDQIKSDHHVIYRLLEETDNLDVLEEVYVQTIH